ncbi:MAG TPA: hypothetical protein VHL59_19760 [Thermoanaerobaculia bacterium]|nr:hypothetical protein [Thermoanaerobaculia bacterium]
MADLLRIRSALQTYLRTEGPLPMPAEYGEGEASKSPGFWQNWWDVSGVDGDGDGKPFLDFLADSGVMPSVPVDPENRAAADGGPLGGRQYVYFVVPPDYDYAGGSCLAGRRWVYMLGITDLRSEVARPPKNIRGSGCDCLWRDQPNLFQDQFDYVVCGTFEATPESRARAAETRARQAAAALAAKQAAADLAARRAAAIVAEKRAAELRKHLPQDRRRVASLLQIRKGLQTYLQRVGPLPTPLEYGEAERSKGAGFWHQWWDVSTEDGDGDGRPFLDFLVESGTMPSVPVDPENLPAQDGDPTGGRQFVYFVVPPDYDYEGGSCLGRNKIWVYMLGITDLRSEVSRPPKNIRGSGCDCLWRNHPNLFQQHFDYVICGTFRR